MAGFAKMNDPSQPSKNPPPLAEWLPEDDSTRGKPQKTEYQKLDTRRSILSALSPEVDRHLRQANLLRVRGDMSAAERELRSALDVDPTAGSVHEMLGDVLLMSGSKNSALESYRRAQSCGAGASIEAKIGRLLVNGDTDSHIQANTVLIRGGGVTSYIASALVPGLGLALAGEMRVALISFSGWLITLCAMLVLPPTKQVLNSLGGHGGTLVSPGATLLFLMLGLANLGFYIYSMIETARIAKAAGKDGQDD